MTSNLTVHTVISQVFGQNTFIVQLDGSDHCLIIDPGFDTEALRRFLEDKELIPAAILNTHGHIDHIAGNEALKKSWPDCPLVIGSHEAEKLTDPRQNLSEQYGQPIISPPADVLLNDGDIYKAADIELEVTRIPGHSRGHVVYTWKGSEPWIVFGGDVLFQGSIGRTDFPDGDTQQLLDSIRDKLFCMPDDTAVMTGHGNSTTIGAEKMHNPFVGEKR